MLSGHGRLNSVLLAFVLSVLVSAVYGWVFSSVTGWPGPVTFGVVWLLYLWVEFWVKPYRFPDFADFIDRLVGAVVFALVEFFLMVVAAIAAIIVMVPGSLINYFGGREIIAYGPALFVVWCLVSAFIWWCVWKENEEERSLAGERHLPLVSPDDLPGI